MVLAVAVMASILVVVNPVAAGAVADPPVSTVAGGLVSGAVGDGGPAVGASLYYPSGIDFDGVGNLYIADREYDRIRRVDTNGVITTVAGNGQRGYSGDGGSAVEASLNQPYDVAVGPDRAIYIADYGNHRVRRVDTSGKITTVAGTGTTVANGDGLPATAMTVSGPMGVVVDGSGVLYVSDYNLHRVIRVAADGTAIYMAGNGSAGFSGDGGPATSAALRNPRGLALDVDGSLLIADYNNHRVRRVATDGTITTVIGTGSSTHSGDGGPATAAAVPTPVALAVGPDGKIYVASYGSHRVRVIDPGTGVVTTFVGNGGAGVSANGTALGSASVRNPMGVALDPAGNLVVSLTVNHLVRSTSGGVVNTVAGGPDPNSRRFNGDGPGLTTQLGYPRGMSLGPDGELVFADAANNRIRRLRSDGSVVTVVGSGASGFNGNGLSGPETALYWPYGVAHGPDGTIYFTESSGNRVRRVMPDGTVRVIAGDGTGGFLGDGGPGLMARLASPRGLAVAADGTVYVADYSNQRVRRIAPDGTISTFAGTGLTGWNGAGLPAAATNLSSPRSISLGGDGYLYVAASSRVLRIGPAGTVEVFAGTGSGASGPDATALTTNLGGVEMVEAGRDLVVVSDYVRHRLRLIGDPPSAVTGLAVVPDEDGTGARVTWNPPGETGGLAVDGHSVTVDDADAVVSVGPDSATVTGLKPGARYRVTVTARTIAGDGESASVSFTEPVPTPADPGSSTGPDPDPSAVRGYWMVTSTGRALGFGDVPTLSSPSGSDIVAAASPRGSSGLLLLHADGRVTARDGAVWRGDMSGIDLDAPMVAMAVTPSGDGYWLLGADGGVFAFGDARFLGSTGGMKLVAPVVDIATTPSGEGYWLVAADGGVFTFGDAEFRGSAAMLRLDAPIRSVAAEGSGYRMVAADGGVFVFGLPFRGSVRSRFPGVPAPTLPRAVRVRNLPGGGGYLVLTDDGTVSAFGGDGILVPPGSPVGPGERVVDLVLVAGGVG